MMCNNWSMPQSRAELRCSGATKISRSYPSACFVFLRNEFYLSIKSCYYICYIFLILLFDCYLFLLLLLLLCGDIELNPGPRNSLTECRVLYQNIRGLYRNISDLQVVSQQYDIVLCSETLVSNRRHAAELILPGFSKPTQLLRGSRPRVCGLAAYIRSGFSASICKDHICTCHEIQLIKVSSRVNNFYIFSIYRNPDLDDSIYDCLLGSMGNIQEMDPKSAFIFVGDVNAHHREWLNSVSPTDCHGIAAVNFATLSGCEQIIGEPTHRLGNCLDLLFTDVPAVVNSVVQPPLGTSDHSGLSFKLKLTHDIPNLVFNRKVYLKSRIDWDSVCNDVINISWRTIYNASSPIDELNSVLDAILSRRVPTRIIKRRMRDKAWFNGACVDAFNNKQDAYRLWSRNRSRTLWDNYVRQRRRAQSVYSDAQQEYNNSLRVSLSGETQSHRWWSSLKSFLFGVDTALPPIRRNDGSLAYDPSDVAEVFSSVFQGKQSNQKLSLPPTCFPSPDFSYFAFKSSEVRYYLSNLDSHGGTDPCNMFPLFFKKTANQLAPKLSKIFRYLLASGSFPESWRVANVTPIPKGSSPTQYPLDYRPISITPILSKIFEKLLARRIYGFVNSRSLLPSTQFGFRKGLGTADALLNLTHDLQLSLDQRAESRVVSLDFSSAFDLVNHHALLYKLRSIGFGGPIYDILSQFLSNRKQRVCVDGKFSAFQPVVSGVPQGSVLGPILFILYTSDMWNGLENKIVSYADDTTVYAEVKCPADRATVSDSLNRDLVTIESWCNTWGMKLNPSKTSTIIVSRSRTLHPPHPPLQLCGSFLEVSRSIRLLGVVIDDKLTFEDHIRSTAGSIAQKTGLIRKCVRALGNDDDAVLRSFYGFLLPCFEYASPVWCSAADSHLKLLDRALNNIRFFLPNVSVELAERRRLACLSMLYKIFHDSSHPLHSGLPPPFVHVRATRFALALNEFAFSAIRFNTNQFARCFLPSSCKVWNDLPNEVFDCPNYKVFKSAVKRHYDAQ